MKDKKAFRERYLVDALPVRLGGLAANLSRIHSFSDHADHRDVVENLIEESKYFIEWTALDADSEIQSELVRLQIQLALWQNQWEHIWADPEKRMAVVEKSHVWSQRILELSGLL